MIQSLGPGPGPLRPSTSSDPARSGVFLLLLELGELERLRRVGVGQGVKLGLRRRVRIVSVTTPFFSCCWSKVNDVLIQRQNMKIILSSGFRKRITTT